MRTPEKWTVRIHWECDYPKRDFVEERTVYDARDASSAAAMAVHQADPSYYQSVGRVEVEEPAP